MYFDNFWHSDTEVNLQQNCNRIAHLSWWLLSPYLVQRNISQFVHNSSNVSYKIIKLRRNIIHSKCSKYLLLVLRHILKIATLINCLINEALLVTDLVSIRCSFSSLTSLVSGEHVSACRFQSVSPGSGVMVFFSCSHG